MLHRKQQVLCKSTCGSSQLDRNIYNYYDIPRYPRIFGLHTIRVKTIIESPAAINYTTRNLMMPRFYQLIVRRIKNLFV